MATSNSAVSHAQSDRCPQCLGRVVEHPTEHVCDRCGLVVNADPIDRGPDWRDYGEGNDGRHAEPGNRTLADRGLGAAPRAYEPHNRASTRQHDQDKQAASGTKKDRNRAYATTEVSRIAGALELPDCMAERAKYLFRELHENGGVEGHNLDTMAAACVHLAGRERGYGRTAGEVADVTRNGDENTIARRFRWVAAETNTEVPPPDYRQRVRVVGAALECSQGTIRSAMEYVDEVDRVGVSPSTVAAACLYLASEHTQIEVAEVADVAPVSLRTCRDEITE